MNDRLAFCIYFEKVINVVELEVMIVQYLKEALRVKDTSVFELVNYTFYERDFVFFAQLIDHLGVLYNDCDKTELMDFAKLSQLLYLSSLLRSNRLLGAT